MRKGLIKLHRWASLVVAVPLFVIGITGAILVYGEELDAALSPKQFYVRAESAPLPIQKLVESVKAAYPGEGIRSVLLPADSNRSVPIFTEDRRFVYVNPYSAEVLGARYLESGFRRTVLHLHTELLAGDVGSILVIVATFTTIFLTISGIILWWKFKTWRLKWWKSWRRMNFDFHNFSGFYTAIVLLALSVTGAAMAYGNIVNPALIRLGGESTEAPPLRSAHDAGRPVDIDRVIAVAEQAASGAHITYVGMPTNETDVYTVFARFPEDPAVFGRSRVFIDQYQGDVVGVRSSRDAGWTRHLVNIIEPIHYGDIFGTGSQIVALVASLLLSGQVVSGLLIWWKKRKSARPGNRAQLRPERSPGA